MTLGLKLLLWKNRNFWFQKNSRYVFSIAINVFLWDCTGKGTCIKRTGGVRNYSTNTIMEKNIFRGIEEIASGFAGVN